MNFFNDLIEAKFIKRYKRFLSEHKLVTGEKVLAHCPNTGPMLGLLKSCSKTFLSKSNNKNRKLKYTWELIIIDGQLIGINTLNANKIFYDSLLAKKVKKFSKYNNIYKEVKYGKNCRIDFKLENKRKKNIWIEVKSVTLSRIKHVAEFPDTITHRGTKQLEQLESVINKGDKVYIIYLIQRENINYFKIAKDIDPKYYNVCMQNKSLGMEILAFKCNLSKKAIDIDIDNKVKIIYE